jgi:hypothetical protein
MHKRWDKGVDSVGRYVQNCDFIFYCMVCRKLKSRGVCCRSGRARLGIIGVRWSRAGAKVMVSVVLGHLQLPCKCLFWLGTTDLRLDALFDTI